MDVAIAVFYKEAAGDSIKERTIPNSRTVKEALTRWGIPFYTKTEEGATKQFWKVNLCHLEKAKAARAAEMVEREKRRKKRAPKNATNGQHEPLGLMERMAAVEQELRTLNATLTAFIKKYE